MTRSVWGPLWRFAVFAGVCLVAMAAMVAVFGQLRFDSSTLYRAEFTSVTGLEKGNFVRIAGVEVGKVKNISIHDNTTAMVEFSTDHDVTLTRGTRAVVRYENLIGGRYLALEEGPGTVDVLRPGQTIPLANTEPALDLDALIGGFKPLFRALKPEQVNQLSTQLIAAFQGEGGTVASVLAQTAQLANTLADRGQLIGDVIDNLHTVVASLRAQSGQLDKTVTSLSQLVEGLSADKEGISDSLGNINAAAGSVADLLTDIRPPLKQLVTESDRTAANILADNDYFTKTLETMPDIYRVLARQGIYGDFFSFYLCDIYFKLNGKGGEPVTVKVAGQTTGRCAPK
jgi:phospholipid/cholesterol/gamma-HCH transport system substrate-binding protein